MTMTTPRKVIITPPTITPQTLMSREERLRRVAAYARVSTDTLDQLNSYEAQVNYYTDLIQKNPDYEFVGVYTDEGITGVNADKRDGFHRMVADALAGKIDLILIKTISRLGRNTVLVLDTVRKLRAKGVEIYFENENISTLEQSSEVMLTIYCSLAQEESRRISENVKWGIQRRMESQKPAFAYSSFLGFDKQEDGSLAINEEQAQIVRLIYRRFLSGMTIRGIAKHLTDRGIPTPMRKSEVWSISTVKSILRNEKYKGDLVMGKTFTPDFLTKKAKKNQGESYRYEYEGVLPAIISPEAFELVQAELLRRRGAGRGQSGVGVFSSKVVCGACGGFYGAKVWHSNTKYRRKIHRCNRKYENENHCPTPHFTEEQLKDIFIHAVNQVLSDKDAIIRDLREMIGVLTDTTDLDRQHLDLIAKRDALYEKMTRLVRENAQVAMDQEAFNRQYYGMESKYLALNEKIQAIVERIAHQVRRCGAMDMFMDALAQRDSLLVEFDDALWFTTTNQMTVNLDGTVTVQFRTGMEITVTP